MSRRGRRGAWGAPPALALLLAACAPAGPAHRAPPGGPAGGPVVGVPSAPALPAEEPQVRVGIMVDTTAIEATADVAFQLTADGREVGESAAGERWVFTEDAEGRIVGRSHAGREVGPVAGPLVLRPAAGGHVRLGERPYRGTALIVPRDSGRVSAVNVVDLEGYLLGVVPSEIPSLALEAVKAQAVAARTYAVGNMGSRSTLGFDFYATVADQVYGGVAREDTMAARAVRETRGEIVTYGGAPILAYYHSTCGGHTAAIDEVWDRPPQPYLRSVSDARPDGSGYYCDISSRFDWHEEWTGAALQRIVGKMLAQFFRVPAAQLGAIQRLSVEERTTSGRVAVLGIDAGGRHYRIHGDSIRWILRPEEGRILNSILFDLRQERSDGGVRRLSVDGHGWGHGIGMCQMGAIGRAKAGQDYHEILRAYYTGTDITRLY